MSRVVLVAGTHSWKTDACTDWYCPESAFVRFLKTQGVDAVFGATAASPRPFTWSTSLGGVGFGDRDLIGWAAAGVNLYQYIVPPLFPEGRLPAADTNIIAHSHGLQVVLFACSLGLKVNTLISVGSPVRKDMEEAARKARPNIGYWLHLHSDMSDRWQVFGEFFDGHLGIVREHPLADRNDGVPKVGHSEVLRDPQHFHLWTDRNWLTWPPALKAAA